MYPTLSIRQVPLLRLSILVMIGMTLARVLLGNLDSEYLVIGGVSTITLLVVYYLIKSPILKSFIVNALAIIIGICLYNSYTLQHKIDADHVAQFTEDTQRIYEIENISNGEKYATLFTTYLGNSYTATKERIGVVIKVKNKNLVSAFERGALIISSSKVRPIQSKPTPTGFDYGQYLKDQGYQFQLFTAPQFLSYEEHGVYPWYRTIRYDVRNYCLSVFDRSLDPATANITKALVLGDRSGLDDETRASYADSGIIHILAVSGLHVGIIAFLLFHVVGRAFWWLRKHHWIKSLFIILGLLAFAELSGGAAPVWRAVIMSSIYLISLTIGRRTHSLNLMGLAAIIILLLRPTDLFTVSFQLSFAAVGGILLFSPWFFTIYEPQNYWLKKAWVILVLGICAQIGTLPLTLYYFHQFTTLSPVAGLVAIPAAFFILCFGIGLLLSASILPAISVIFSFLLKWTVLGLNTTATSINDIPLSLIKNIWISEITAVLIICSLIVLSLWLYVQKRYFFNLGIGLIVTALLSHITVRGYQYHTPQEVVYSEAPLAIDIILRGTCYHYNEDSERPVNDYLTKETRSKYSVNYVEVIDASYISQLLKGKE